MALARAARRSPVRRVHVVGVARPEHLRTVARLRRELLRSRHEVALQLAPPAPGAGKWANINAALSPKLDLSINAARKLGMLSRGVAPVRVRIV